MSSEGTPVLAGTIPALEMLMTNWELMALNLPDYALWIQKGLDCALKYYRHVDDTRAHLITLCKC
jgi:hypothetical protein